jgi:hypothetical protein
MWWGMCSWGWHATVLAWHLSSHQNNVPGTLGCDMRWSCCAALTVEDGAHDRCIPEFTVWLAAASRC